LITWTSGHDASWDAGRGLCGWALVDGGGRTPGGTALGGDSGLRRNITTATTTNNTTAATANAATQASIRWRLRRALVVMFSC
jgi:hypothetical protein